MLLSFLSFPAVPTQMGALDLEKRDDQGLCVAQRWWPRIVYSFFMFRRCRMMFFQSSWIGVYLVYLLDFTWKDGLNLHRYTQAICKRAPIFTACWPKMTRSGHFCAHERVKILHIDNISLRRSVFICCFQKCSCCNAITTPHNALQSIRLFINPFKKRNLFEQARLACQNTRTTQWSIKTGTLHEAPKMYPSRKCRIFFRDWTFQALPCKASTKPLWLRSPLLASCYAGALAGVIWLLRHGGVPGL